jgi:DNA-binding IclR family transcriptional regulator
MVISRASGAVSATEPGAASVNRALSLLAAFSADQPVLTLAQLAARTGLYKSTILRLAQSLSASGYLMRTEAGAYTIGPAPMHLADVYRRGLPPADRVMPVLSSLARATGNSASLYLRAGPMRVCAYRASPPRAMADSVHEGDLLPLDQGAGGQILLAFSGAKSLRHESIRRRLITVTRGERDPAAAAMAIPVFSLQQRLYGTLSLSGAPSRFTPKAVAKMHDALIEAAQALTLSLGGDPHIYQHAMLGEQKEDHVHSGTHLPETARSHRSAIGSASWFPR